MKATVHGEIAFVDPAAPTMAGLLAVLLAAAAVAVNLLVSANLLAAIGVPYSGDGGSLLVKLHPGTYLALLSAVALLWRHPVVVTRELLRTARVPLLYLTALAGCFVLAAAATGKVHLVVFLENFMPAGLLALVLGRTSACALRWIAALVLALLALNVLLSVAETLLQRHFIPILLDGHEEAEHAADFRGAALYDHPLTGAMLTSAGLFVAQSARVPRLWRAVLGVTFVLGLISFGGRTALALSVLVFGAWQGGGLACRVLRGQATRLDLALGLVVLLVVPALLVLLVTQSSLGARLVSHLYWDESAQVRSVQWHLLPMMEPGEALFGMTLARQETALHQLSLQWPIGAIENFWLLLYLYCGAAGFVLFLAGFLPFLAWTFKSAGLPGRLMLVTVMLAASSSNSLGHKANLLTVLVPLALASRAMQQRAHRAAALTTVAVPSLRPPGQTRAVLGQVREPVTGLHRQW